MAFSAVDMALAVTRGDSVPGVMPWRLPDIDYVVQGIVFSLVGAVIASRHPQNLVWLLLSALGLAGVLFRVGNEYTIYAQLRHPGSLPGGSLGGDIEVRSVVGRGATVAGRLPIGQLANTS